MIFVNLANLDYHFSGNLWCY